MIKLGNLMLLRSFWISQASVGSHCLHEDFSACCSVHYTLQCSDCLKSMTTSLNIIVFANRPAKVPLRTGEVFIHHQSSLKFHLIVQGRFGNTSFGKSVGTMSSEQPHCCYPQNRSYLAHAPRISRNRWKSRKAVE